MTSKAEIIFLSIFKLILIVIFIKSKNRNKKNNIYVLHDVHSNLNRILKEMDSVNQEDILKEKTEFINYMKKHTRGKFTDIKYIYIGAKTSYENSLMILNKALFYCELVNCKKIILDKKYYWFINKNYRFNKKKIEITRNYLKNLEYKDTIVDRSLNLIIFNRYILPENKIYLFKNEILKNFPEVKTSPTELYLYIKSGDIFLKTDQLYHIQPPLCFYKEIIENHTQGITNITIVSELDKNIAINKLQKDYPNVTFNEIPFKVSFAYLTKAYNIAGANCPLLYFIIRLNDNLRNFWEYDTRNDINNEKLSVENALKFVKNRKINYYRMSTTDYYKNTQLFSKDTFYKFYLMFNHKCENFSHIEY